MGTLNTHANFYQGYRKGKRILVANADCYYNHTVQGVQTLPNFGYDVVCFGLHCIKRNKKGKWTHKI